MQLSSNEFSWTTLLKLVENERLDDDRKGKYAFYEWILLILVLDQIVYDFTTYVRALRMKNK